MAEWTWGEFLEWLLGCCCRGELPEGHCESGLVLTTFPGEAVVRLDSKQVVRAQLARGSHPRPGQRVRVCADGVHVAERRTPSQRRTGGSLPQTPAVPLHPQIRVLPPGGPGWGFVGVPVRRFPGDTPPAGALYSVGSQGDNNSPTLSLPMDWVPPHLQWENLGGTLSDDGLKVLLLGFVHNPLDPEDEHGIAWAAVPLPGLPGTAAWGIIGGDDRPQDPSATTVPGLAMVWTTRVRLYQVETEASVTEYSVIEGLDVYSVTPAGGAHTFIAMGPHTVIQSVGYKTDPPGPYVSEAHALGLAGWTLSGETYFQYVWQDTARNLHPGPFYTATPDGGGPSDPPDPERTTHVVNASGTRLPVGPFAATAPEWYPWRFPNGAAAWVSYNDPGPLQTLLGTRTVPVTRITRVVNGTLLHGPFGALPAETAFTLAGQPLVVTGMTPGAVLTPLTLTPEQARAAREVGVTARPEALNVLHRFTNLGLLPGNAMRAPLYVPPRAFTYTEHAPDTFTPVTGTLTGRVHSDPLGAPRLRRGGALLSAPPGVEARAHPTFTLPAGGQLQHRYLFLAAPPPRNTILRAASMAGSLDDLPNGERATVFTQAGFVLDPQYPLPDILARNRDSAQPTRALLSQLRVAQYDIHLEDAL